MVYLSFIMSVALCDGLEKNTDDGGRVQENVHLSCHFKFTLLYQGTFRCYKLYDDEVELTTCWRIGA